MIIIDIILNFMDGFFTCVGVTTVIIEISEYYKNKKKQDDATT